MKMEWETKIQLATAALKNICKILNMDYRDVSSQFATYLAEVDNEISRILRPIKTGGDVWNWGMVEDIVELSDLAEIALRIQPTPASEASAERAISLQRWIIVARRNRAKQDLVESRISIMMNSRKTCGVSPRVKIW